jgi:predicted HTH transcriptional regulator
VSRPQAMHDNSLAAYRQYEGRLSTRCERILAWILEHGDATDRQIMRGLGYTDPNKVRPRITELIKVHHKLAELRHEVDPETNTRVRVVGLPRGQLRLIS